MRTKPPTVPGIERRNSMPRNPRIARGRGDEDARRAAAAAQRGRRRSPRPSQRPCRAGRRRPGKPPSRTIRFEPRPSAITGTAGSRSREEIGEIVGVLRFEQPVGGAARLEPDERCERRVAPSVCRARREGCRSLTPTPPRSCRAKSRPEARAARALDFARRERKWMGQRSLSRRPSTAPPDPPPSW